MGKKNQLFEIADRQQGYFTAGQARTCGYHDSHFQRYIKSMEWTKTGRGIYRLTHYPIAERPDLIEWSLWSRDKKGDIQGVWSHETALDIYELCDIMPAKLHMTVPRYFRKSVATPTALKLYFADLRPVDWIEQHGYRVTTLLRTLLDLAQTRQISDDLLEQALIAAKQKGFLLKSQIDSLPETEAGLLIKRFYAQ